MDRNGYNNLINEAQALMKSGGEEDALDLLDSVNWRKIRNVNALIEISNLYEKLGHIEDSKELLKFAHERSPIGRMILYHLTLVCVKMGELDEAQEYTDEFVKIAPHDSKKYELRYNIAKARNASIKELIDILEDMKNNDFIEEWAFELAYLYHRAGDADKCIALCDEIIIWFGDGPYVAKALELKMLYSPLEDDQAEKYRDLQECQKGFTHFKANEMLESGEVLTKDISIPSVQESTGKFNTVNLQAEIKRNIEEIMEATEEGDVSDTLENIKGLIEDIPYLQVQEDLDDVVSKQKEEGKEIDNSIKNKFEELLEEDRDGQISLFVPEEGEKEEQIEGQMTIQDIMDNWEKTKRAAKEALESGEEVKLQQAKDNALEEANQIMDRLEDAIPKLNAGVTPSELMKEEVMLQAEKAKEESEAQAEKEEAVAKTGQEEAETKDKPVVAPVPVPVPTPVTGPVDIPTPVKTTLDEPVKEAAPVSALEKYSTAKNIEETPEDKIAETESEHAKKFTVPKFTADGEEESEVGLEIPVIEPEKEHVIGDATTTEDKVNPEVEGMSEWKPPVLSEEEIKDSKVIRNEDKNSRLEEASKIVEDINKALQNQIDEEIRKQGETSVVEDTLEEAEISEPEDELPQEVTVEEELEPIPVNYEPEDVEPLDEDDVVIAPEVIAPEVQRMKSGWEVAKTQVLPKIDVDAIMQQANNDIQLEDDEEDEEEYLYDEPENIDDTQRLAFAAAGESLEDDPFKSDRDVEEDELPEIAPVELEEEPDEDDNSVELTSEEREIFSYFMPIDGMEKKICRVLTGTRDALVNKDTSRGNVIIQGIPGCGKTMLATSLVKVLQGQINLPTGNIGKVDGDKLNGKDIHSLFSKIKGGCLIIEKAGEINRETAIKLSLMMENDTTGVLVIIEDTKMGIERLSKLSGELVKKFTEKIVIPPFTIDELVNFAKAYATDCECVIEEMGILAIYDRINIIQSLDHPTAIAEVKEIMDEAMENADKGGFRKAFERFGNKKYDDNGFMILREKDFQN